MQEASARRSVAAIALFLLALALIYIITIPGNKTEADDAFHYSRQVELEDAPAPHPHHLVYIPAMRMLFNMFQAVGYSGRPYPMLLAVSLVSGIGCLVLLLRGIPFGDKRGGWLAATMLAALYGFWRYSVDVEIVIPATLLAIAAFCWAFSFKGTSRNPLPRITGIVLATGGILLHTANIVPLLAVVPYILWRRHGLRSAIIQGGFTVLAVGLFYASIWDSLPAMRLTGQEKEGLLQAGTWVKSLVAAGHSLLSGSFLFAWPAFSSWMQQVFPYRMLEEQIMIGRYAPSILRMLAPLTFGAAIFALLIAANGIVRETWRRLRSFIDDWRQGRFSADSGDIITEAAWLWVLGSALMIMLFEPGNPELWVWTHAPIAILFGRSNTAKSTYRSCMTGSRKIYIVPLLIALHNVVGGVALIQDEKSDYYAVNSADVRRIIEPGDIVITGAHAGFVFYLEYHMPDQVVYAGTISDERLNELVSSDKRLLVMPCVLEPSAPLRYRFPHHSERIDATRDRLKPDLRPIAGTKLHIHDAR